MAGETLRTRASAWVLVRRAIGGPRQVRDKLVRAARTVRTLIDAGEVDRRLRALEARGFVAARPGRLQIAFGAIDMLRFVIVPSARDYYARQGIDFRFHQLLRFLDDPVSVVDPTGFLSERDTIIGHLMQVVHLNPVYDLQLLQMFPDGLEELERQVARMVEGTHPRASTIGAVVEDPGYHARLLDYVRRYRQDPSTGELVRESTLRGDPSYAAAERAFATLPGFVAYCHGLPARARPLLRRWWTLDRFPVPPAAEAAGGRSDDP